MTKTIPQLIQAANEAATAGKFQEAERHWNEVRRVIRAIRRPCSAWVCTRCGVATPMRPSACC